MPHVVPFLDVDVHVVLCRFGRAGLAYVETDPTEADATTVVRNLLYGQYGEPLRVVALNVEEGWSRDISEAIACHTSVLVAILFVVPCQAAQVQTKSGWRWGMWEIEEYDANGRLKKAPQAAVDEMNGRGAALILLRCL